MFSISTDPITQSINYDPTYWFANEESSKIKNVIHCISANIALEISKNFVNYIPGI